jgi:hypothetical protein
MMKFFLFVGLFFGLEDGAREFQSFCIMYLETDFCLFLSTSDYF